MVDDKKKKKGWKKGPARNRTGVSAEEGKNLLGFAGRCVFRRTAACYHCTTGLGNRLLEICFAERLIDCQVVGEGKQPQLGLVQKNRYHLLCVCWGWSFEWTVNR